MLTHTKDTVKSMERAGLKAYIDEVQVGYDSFTYIVLIQIDGQRIRRAQFSDLTLAMKYFDRVVQ